MRTVSGSTKSPGAILNARSAAPFIKKGRRVRKPGVILAPQPFCTDNAVFHNGMPGQILASHSCFDRIYLTDLLAQHILLLKS